MKKVLYQNQPQIFEKLVRARDGRLFRVRFRVREADGRVWGKVVSAEPVQELRGRNDELGKRKGRGTCQHFLPITKKAAQIRSAEFSPPRVSPYFRRDLSFVTSQPIRAPSSK